MRRQLDWPVADTVDEDDTVNIAIIGAGYSGVSLAFNLHRLMREPARITLYERRKQHGLGAAYATTHPEHLLNVPAGGMSGLADDPDHFVKFLRRDPDVRPYIRSDVPLKDQFLPRMIYGRYIQSLLAQCQKPSAHGVVVETITDEVINAEAVDDGFILTTRSGHGGRADRLILATGNAAPANGLLAGVPTRQLIADPWDYDAIRQVPHHATVLVVGTGLTMVDTVIALRTLGHHGPIVALSRRGLLPHRHRSLGYGGPAEWKPDRLRRLRRKICTTGRQLADTGRDWREVVNALRFSTQEFWCGLSLAEQKSFLRHLAPYWETHRHRLAPEIGDKLQAMIASGQLSVVAGKIAEIHAPGAGRPVHLHVRLRAGGRHTTIAADMVVNCTGPDANILRNRDPLTASLLQQGLIRPDAHRMGLDVAENGALINNHGEVSETLYTLGPTTRGRWYEIVAVPDIRRQSLQLAKHLVLHGAALNTA